MSSGGSRPFDVKSMIPHAGGGGVSGELKFTHKNNVQRHIVEKDGSLRGQVRRKWVSVTDQ